MTVAACRGCGRVIAVKAGSSAACPNCGWSSDAPRATKPFLPDLRDGLALARGANGLSVLLSLGLLGVQVFVVSVPGPDAARYGLPLAIVLGIGLLIALIGHLAGQF